jgi:ketosteroid isomerase-like protein
MSSPNAATIRELYAQLMGPGCMEDRARVEVVPRFFADDVEMLQMRSILGTGGRFLGHRGVREATLELLRDFADAMFIPQDVRAVGDRVATAVLFRGKGRRSGAPVEIRVGHLFTLRDGLIVRWEVFEDPRAALGAAGAVGEGSEDPA